MHIIASNLWTERLDELKGSPEEILIEIRHRWPWTARNAGGLDAMLARLRAAQNYIVEVVEPSGRPRSTVG